MPTVVLTDRGIQEREARAMNADQLLDRLHLYLLPLGERRDVAEVLHEIGRRLTRFDEAVKHEGLRAE